MIIPDVVPSQPEDVVESVGGDQNRVEQARLAGAPRLQRGEALGGPRYLFCVLQQLLGGYCKHVTPTSKK